MSQPSDPTTTPPPPPPTPPPGIVSPEDAKNLAALAHGLNFCLIAPLIIYLLKKGQNAFLDGEAKEALNFSITCAIAHVALVILGITPFYLGALFLLLRMALWIAQIVLGVMGAMKARDGIPYRYPINLRLIN